MLAMKNVTKTFGKFKALDDLSMSVPKGSVYGLVGPNGAGKSTAIRLMTGIYRPDSGSVTLEGMPVYENPVNKVRMGYIPDDIFYFPSASMEEMRIPSLMMNCMKSSLMYFSCPRKVRSAGFPRVCRSRRRSIWPSAPVRRC